MEMWLNEVKIKLDNSRTNQMRYNFSPSVLMKNKVRVITNPAIQVKERLTNIIVLRASACFQFL